MCKAIQEMYDDGVKDGIQKGVERGIAAVIRTCRNLNVSEEDTLNNVQREYELSMEEAKKYLEHSGALLLTPYQRLQKLNPAAIGLYREHGIDLSNEMLEIAVCAQHQNGGADVDVNWQTSVTGLYAVGEALDIDGACGGYNLHWAFASGLRAGRSAARD